MKRGDIADCHKYFWMSSSHAVIEQREKSRRPVTVAHAKDCLDLAIGEHLHQVRGALAIATCKKAPALFHVRCQLHFESEASQHLDRPVSRFRIGWRAGGRHDADRVAVT